MGRPIRSDAKPEETTNFAWNTKNDLAEKFYAILKRKRLPMYIILEAFMKQFCDGGFKLEEKQIHKFDRDMKDSHLVHTMVDKRTYLMFKSLCEEREYRIKSVMSAFMEKFVKEEYVLELKSTADAEKEREKCNCLNALMRFYELMKEEEQETQLS